MKRIWVLFVLLPLVMVMGQAQQNSGLEVFLSSGFVMPSSPMTFANYWKMQAGGSLGVGIPLTPSITLVGSVEYYRFQLNVDGVNKGFDTKYMRDIWIFSDVSLNPSADPSSVMTASVNVRVAPSAIKGWLSPYLVAGIGMMKFSLSEISLPTTSVLSLDSASVSFTARQRIIGGEETDVFFQSGLGFDVHFSSLVNLFLEARYTHGFSKGLGTAYIPITAGVRMYL